MYWIFILQDTYAVLPQSGQAQLRVFNGLNCTSTVNVSGYAPGEIEPLDFWKAPTLQVDGEKIFPVNIDVGPCSYNFDTTVNVTEKEVTCNKYMLRT